MRLLRLNSLWAICVTGCLFLVGQAAVKANDSDTKFRFATYNVSLYGQQPGAVKERLRDGKDQQAESIAAIVQTVRPDVLLLNEIDYDADHETVTLLIQKFFHRAADDREPIDYPYVYAASSNTGEPSALDLNVNGKLGEPNDCWGFGLYPGQYAFAVLSRFPIDESGVRTFQKLLWSNVPDPLRPMSPDGVAFHSDDVWQQIRLSSKNHADVPIRVANKVVHVLASHPTPPVFDGPEDLNGCRNHDEIRFWQLYIDGKTQFKDDAGKVGGLASDVEFVIMGDLNSDETQGGSRPAAIQSLLRHPRITDPLPKNKRPAGAEYSDLATANFGRVGKYRVDYVLPSRGLRVGDSAVFWPLDAELGAKWIHASDHRLVWVDVTIAQ